MKRLTLVVLVLSVCACPGPGVVSVTEPDDAGVLADAGTKVRLVKVMFAMQTEPDERAVYEAIRAAARMPHEVDLSTGLCVFGERNWALVQPFSAPALLAERPFAAAALDQGRPFDRELAEVAEVVVADFATLSPADQQRVEYRVLYLVEPERQLNTCAPVFGGDRLQWCAREIITATRRLRSIVELWGAGRVTVQPIAITGGAGLSEPARQLLATMAREGGTSPEQATLAELPATLSRLTARLAE